VLAVAQALEQGRFRGPVARALSRVWAEVARRQLVRALPRPGHVRLLAIGGATLGGSGKTPLAIACARALADSGVRVALVGHAYGGKPGRARVVSPADPLADVGDEAILAAIALAPARAQVVVAPRRAEAVELAATLADVLVVDGLVQTRPRATLALLAVDTSLPWGRAAAPPPCGDLRASPDALRAATDLVVPVGDGSTEAALVSDGVEVDGRRLGWAELAGLRLGLVTVLGRPQRVLESLARRSVIPSVVVSAADHGPLAHDALHSRVDLWLASPKCALHAAACASRSAPVAILQHELALSSRLRARLGLACLDPRGRGQ
jgi:tetraacyldisaccharide 4'-kinase